MTALHVISLILLIVGGLNWGLVALSDFDLVTAIFGTAGAESAPATAIARVVYLLVALSAVLQLFRLVTSAAASRPGIAVD